MRASAGAAAEASVNPARGFHGVRAMRVSAEHRRSNMTHNRRNYYRILHVQPDAPTEVIKSSYRTLMLKLKQHPDLGGDHCNATLINEAYAVLANPKTRDAYNRELLSRYNIAEVAGSPRGAQGPAKAAPQSIDHYCHFCKTPHSFGNIEKPGMHCVECESPLYPAQKVSFEQDSQRAVARCPQQGEIKIYLRWPGAAIIAQLRDNSPLGARFTLAVSLPIDEIIKMDGEFFSAIGCVTSTLQERPDRHSIGVEFLTLEFSRSAGNFVSVSA